MRLFLFAGLLLLFGFGKAQEISFQSLMQEMVHREASARFPSPAYTCKQFSSYDRASTSPEKRETWFANGDAGHYLRVEENAGRKEYVMMDAPGPGAVVRIWSANPNGTLRVYLDGSEQPVIEAPMGDILTGKWRVGEVEIGQPFGAARSRGTNLYLPIPYANSCKITSDAAGFYYQINYRTYPPGTVVKTFEIEDLRSGQSLLETVGKTLTQPFKASISLPDPALRPLAPGAKRSLRRNGQGAVEELVVRVKGENMPDALRSTVLEIKFDGKTTVWSPVGDFFGTGIGINPYSDWWRTVEEDGTMSCRWIMPYRRNMEAILHNLGTAAVEAGIEVRTRSFRWDDRTMHFYAVWRQQNPIPTRPMQDWNYVQVDGKGVLMGDTLSVVNPVPDWWGEGDEKIYVDGEAFPSHFGTGTEDYYGYAWCSPEPFQAPFHSQVRCDGHTKGNNWGHTTVSRVRTLDAVPFTSNLRFDMEVWHWAECEVGYAATTYLYGVPSITTNRPPSPDEAARGALNPPPPPPPYKIEGAIECEEMQVISKAEGMTFEPQAMQGFGRNTWSNDTHLWGRANKIGDFGEVQFPVEGNEPVKLTLYATKSWDYGIVRFFVNGQQAGNDIDLYSGRDGLCTNSGPIDLGTHAPVRGVITLRVEVVGQNPNALGTKSFFGLDCVVLNQP